VLIPAETSYVEGHLILESSRACSTPLRRVRIRSKAQARQGTHGPDLGGLALGVRDEQPEPLGFALHLEEELVGCTVTDG
jgi:hypothetical protein